MKKQHWFHCQICNKKIFSTLNGTCCCLKCQETLERYCDYKYHKYLVLYYETKNKKQRKNYISQAEKFQNYKNRIDLFMLFYLKLKPIQVPKEV